MVEFKEFESQEITVTGGSLYCASFGDGPPLVLLHGFPQNHLMWAKVAPALTQTRKVICFDLPGYGRSSPPTGPEGAAKREMATRICEAMTALGHDRFNVAGHDRGGRVAYRMAFDHPDRVARLAVLDILPTSEYWAKMDHAFAMKIYHWPFLAQPEPLPETLIGGAPDYYIKHTLASWTAANDLSAFENDALETYCAQARDPQQLKAMCDDYRAGESIDVTHDEADKTAGRKITRPTLALWGGAGIAAGAATPLDTWRAWCDTVEGEALDSGHFIPEENPAATINALNRFFS